MRSRDFWLTPMLLFFLCAIALPVNSAGDAPARTLGNFHGTPVSTLTHLQCPEEISQESDSEIREARKSFLKTSLQLQILSLRASAVQPRIRTQNFSIESSPTIQILLAIASAQGTRGPPKA